MVHMTLPSADKLLFWSLALIFSRA